MSKKVEFEIEVDSPRIGGKKVYGFDFTTSHLIIKGNVEVKCQYIDDTIEPVWSGGIQVNPFVQLLQDENVFPPLNFIKAIEIVWKDWISNNITDIQLESEIKVLIDWLNIITKTKPGNYYWADKF
jgi:hypothetical protein